jgi:hypothetical protein
MACTSPVISTRATSSTLDAERNDDAQAQQRQRVDGDGVVVGIHNEVSEAG